MSFPSSVVDLEDKIVASSAHALNVDSTVTVSDFFSGSSSGTPLPPYPSHLLPYPTTLTLPVSSPPTPHEAPITSDVDEQLLLTVPFSTHVKLRGLRLTAPPAVEDAAEETASAPKEVRIYVNQPNMGFEDVDVVKPGTFLCLLFLFKLLSSFSLRICLCPILTNIVPFP